MDLAAKLQLKPGQSIRLVNAPDALLSRDLPATPGPDADAQLLFVRSGTELAAGLPAILDGARADRLTWVAYPKAGGLATDLGRDTLAASLRQYGLRPVRQIALDETWSAIRFRPA